MRNSSGTRRPRRQRTPSMSSRRNAADCLESCTLPGRFLTRRMWPVCADVGEQRVVAAVLPMVRIEAAKGPGDGGAGAHDGAIDIERDPGDVEARQRVEHELLVEPDQ